MSLRALGRNMALMKGASRRSCSSFVGFVEFLSDFASDSRYLDVEFSPMVIELDIAGTAGLMGSFGVSFVSDSLLRFLRLFPFEGGGL